MLIQIRERSFLDLLDLALVVVRHCPFRLGLAAALGLAPFAALNAWIMADPDSSPGALLILLILEAPWATAPVTIVLGSLMFGENVSLSRVLRTILHRLPAMVIYQVVIRSLVLCTVILYPIIPSRFTFMNEVILLERGKTTAVMKRCSTLCDERGGEFFSQWLAQLFFGVLFVICFFRGMAALMSSLTTSELTWEAPSWGDFSHLIIQFALWLVIMFFSVARFLVYIDQRIRLEGWEVKLRLQAVARSLEGSNKW